MVNKTSIILIISFIYNFGLDGDRTHAPLNAIQVRYQLRYEPIDILIIAEYYRKINFLNNKF